MKRLYIPFCLTACLLFSIGTTQVHAQVLQKSLQKIRSLKNASYTDVVGTKFSFQEEISFDTVKSYVLFVPAEPLVGGYYQAASPTHADAFDGNKMVSLNLIDSTYSIGKEAVVSQNTRTLLYWAKNMEKLLKLPTQKIKQLPDTIINNTAYFNIRVISSDTIINKQREYEITNFIIDKKTKLPFLIDMQMLGHGSDGTKFGLIETHAYSNYQLNQNNLINLSTATIPVHFKLPVKRVPVVFLANGIPAPPLIVRSLSGTELDVKSLKGKIVLLNFSLVGCPHCVGAAQMLNRLYDKYGKELVILNIYPFDNVEAISKFDKKEHVKSTSYLSERGVQKVYPFDGYPSFYLLNKDGVIAQSYNGYFKELEAQLIEKIDGMNK